MLTEPVAGLFPGIDESRLGASTVKRPVMLSVLLPAVKVTVVNGPYARESRHAIDVDDSHCVDSQSECPKRPWSVES